MEISDKHYGSSNRLERERAAAGIHQIGTNAIPYLLEWIQYEEPESVTKLREVTKNLTGKYIVPVDDVFRANLTIHAFRCLDHDADAAINELAQIMNRDKFGQPQIRATYALAYTGRPAALAPLMGVIRNYQSPVRPIAVDAIQYFGTNAEPAVPLLIECLKDKDEMVAKDAAWTLAKLKLRPDLVVPALIANANPNRPVQYDFVVGALDHFGTNARPAIPVFLKALQSQSESVRLSATNALKKIAPELLTNGYPH